jgi:hypothetical protein
MELKKFPDLDTDLPNKSDINYFNKIFPEIKNQESYLKNKVVILDYLNLLISTRLNVILKTDLLKNDKARILHEPNGGLSLWEDFNASMDPVYSLKVKNSAAEADQMLKEIFGTSVNLDANDNVNAMRHAAWNMCSVSKIAQASLNKWKGLQKANIIITAHEHKNIVTNGTLSVYIPIPSLGSMDGYNNLVGRTYCYNTIGQTWLGNANNIPSYDKIKADIQTFNIVTVPQSSYTNIYSLATPSLTNQNILGLQGLALDYGNSTISKKLVRF